ncbi:MAG: hypothetical protein QM811_27945 [Pirellulales bacterium]
MKQLLPADWSESLGAAYRGRARYVRRFGRPARLDDDERVRLAVDRPRGRGEIRLNGRPLGPLDDDAETTRFDVTGLLAERNVLEIDLAHAAADVQGDLPGGLIGEVRLEIGRVGN